MEQHRIEVLDKCINILINKINEDIAYNSINNSSFNMLVETLDKLVNIRNNLKNN